MTGEVRFDRPTWSDVEPRRMRGDVYLARLRVRRLEGAWADIDRRTPEQAAAVRQARRIACLTILRARAAGVRPLARR